MAGTPASSRRLADSACYQFGHLGTRLDCEKLSPMNWRGSTFRSTMTMPDGSRACTGSAKGCGLGCGSCDVEASAGIVRPRLKLGQMHRAPASMYRSLFVTVRHHLAWCTERSLFVCVREQKPRSSRSHEQKLPKVVARVVAACGSLGCGACDVNAPAASIEPRLLRG